MLISQDDDELDSLVRKRIRTFRVSPGLAARGVGHRARLSLSSLSRLDQLVETDTDDVIANPMIDGAMS